jgi:SP family arabinose:H+ symporter-like MFS transporter
MTMWVSDWFVNLLFPVMRDSLGIGVTFFIFSFFCILSFFYAKRNLFETKGKSLEEIEKTTGVRVKQAKTKIREVI